MTTTLYPATESKSAILRETLSLAGVKGARIRRMPNGAMRLVLKSLADRDAARDALVMADACTASGMSFANPESRHAWNTEVEIFVRFLEA